MATAVILAAGLGTRMRSTLPKALHPIAGQPMLRHLIQSCEAVFDRIVVVAGPDMPQLEAEAAPHNVVVQHNRQGTADAAKTAEDAFQTDDDVAVLYADNPLIRPDTLRNLLACRQDKAGLVLLSMRAPAPNRYGRVIVQNGAVQRIVEWKDATEAERAEPLCNAGVMCAPGRQFWRWLQAVKPDNAAGEYYLTDVVALANADGVRVAALEAPEEQLRGVNSRAELAGAEAVMQGWLRQAAMDGGATLVAPDTVFLSVDTVLQPDVLVEPHVVFGPGVTVESGATIRAFSHLDRCRVAGGALIGPYARLRPGSVVETGAHVGNFVELKAATLGAGAKANHLAYIGDANVGPGANIGAGTITANYDGVNKHRTQIGARSFIGSNSTLVAPVAVQDGALVAAGTVVTADVPADAMAIGRGRQTNKPDFARMMREKNQAAKRKS